MNDMPADIAEGDPYDVPLDKDGCIWVWLGDGWSYLSDYTENSWDVHPRLLPAYEPYRSLDAVATAFIRAHLNYNKPKNYRPVSG